MYPLEFLDNYDPTSTDDFGLGSLAILSEVERRSVKTSRTLKRLRSE